ncbi:MAG: nucleotide sugar dehydrogenase [Terricaulis sp.]
MKATQTIRDRVICIVGLGYVGLTLAVAMADCGFRVHGLEVRDDVLASLSKGEPHFWEPRLADKLKRVIDKHRLTFSKEPDPKFPATVYVITVGTPFRDGSIYLGAVQHSAKQVAAVMTDGALVILRSTVRLGTAREVVKPILDATRRKFDLAVCPERTLEGHALAELHELPQIIGAEDPDVRARCAHMFGVLTPTTVALSSLEAAELTKLVDNTYRDVTFAFANEVAKLCSHAGLSAREILRAGRLGYPRNKVARPGPVGGPCLEKDPHILFESGSVYGVTMGITQASRAINEGQPADTVALIKEQTDAMKGFPKSPRITLAGVAFKGRPPTDDLRGTMAKPILEALREAFPKGRFKTFDAVVPREASQEFFGIEAAVTLQDAFADANIVVIANDHPVFQSADIASLARNMNAPGIVYDYWSMHDDIEESMPEGVRYLALGGERYQS